MERLDRALDDIIAETKRGGRMRKRNKVMTVVQKRVYDGNKALKMKRLIGVFDGKRYEDSRKVSKYLDVDAPLVDVVQLSYGMDTLPPPSKKIFGSKKMEDKSYGNESNHAQFVKDAL